MANGYRKRSSTSPTGVKRTVTQKQGGGVKTTTSQSTGSSSRVAFTRNANGSAVQTTTRKTGDGYIVRQTKTLVPKYKPVKYPKLPKQPKLKTSVIKETRPKAPPKPSKPRKQKITKFKWPAGSRRSKSSGVGFFQGILFLIVIFGILGVIVGS